ncbi:MAG: transglycosylase SLT domain-containing protein [Candidatus Obscuribacterales bacterium]|nr:transglycosylase SLT domain-containing protein [Candidatus Obscuribacterales bacterium]
MASASMVAIFSTGCAASSDSSTTPPQLTDVLAQQKTLSKEEFRNQLESIYNFHGTPEQTKQEAGYVLARLLETSANKEDQQRAIELFEKSSNHEGLWQRSQWHISECAATLGLENIVRKSLDAIKQKSDSAEVQANADYNLAQSYLRASEQQKAKEAFEYVNKHFSQTQFALGATYYLGEMLIDSSITRDQGLALFRYYLKESPNGKFAITIINRLQALPDYTATEADHDLFGLVYYKAANWNKALAEWKDSDTRWFEKDNCLYRLGRKAEAAEALKADIMKHATSTHVPDAATLLCQMQTKQEAIGTWQMVLGLNDRFADAAQWNLALRAATPDIADGYYKQILATHPTSAFAPESSWWLMWHQAKAGKTAAALASAHAAITKYPQAKSAPRLSFWIGKLNERLKQNTQAIAAYKATHEQYASNYYGYRASQRLAALSGSHDRGWTTQPGRKHPNEQWSWPEPPQLISYTDIAKNFGLTISILSHLRQFQECIDLLPPATPQAKTAHAKLQSWLLSAVNLPLEAINTASRALVGKPQASGLWLLSYPLLHAKAIASEAKAKDVDPLLVHALVREESRYNHMAISRSHALGLMQLLPGTAYGVAKRLGVPISAESDIHLPQNNIKLGTDYLSYVIHRFDGNALCGVASYNGGPNALKTLFNKFRDSGQTDFDVFVEDIPMTETRDYVRKVFGSFWNYESIYGKAGS